MLRRGLHCVITGLGQFRLDLLDPRPDLGKRHVARRLDLGAVYLRWSHIAGQFGSEVKVYSGV